jgi:signal transduction histidine kinase
MPLIAPQLPLPSDAVAVDPALPPGFSGDPVLVRGLAGAVVLLAGIGLAGWLFDIPLLRGFGNPQANMKINTAVMLLLLGGGLFHQTLARPVPFVNGIVGGAVLLLAGATFAEYVFGVDLGIDQLLMAEIDPPAGTPGRMSILTAFCGLLAGTVVLLFAGRHHLSGQSLVLVVGLMAYGSLLGHLFGVNTYYAFGQYSAIAVHTSAALLLAAVGLLLLHPGRGLMPTVLSPLPGGITARAAGRYVLLAPPILAVLSSVLTDRAGFSPASATALGLLVFILGTLVLLYRVSNRLNINQLRLVNELTNRQQAETRQQEQTALLQNIIDNTQVGIGVLTAVRGANNAIVDFRWQITNEANARTTNLPLQTMLGANMLDLLPGTVDSGFFANCARIVETGEPMAYELPYFADGVAGWFDITIVRQNDGVLFSSLDITNRKQAELAVQKQAELLKTVIDTATAGIILYKAVYAQTPAPAAAAITDTDARPADIVDFEVVMANTTGAQLVGRQSRDAFVGRRMRDLLPSEAGRDFFEQVAGVVRTGVPKAWLLPYFNDGIDGWFDMSIIRQDNQAVVTFLDVTEMQQMQRQLEQQNRALLRANEYLRQFVYIASHDLQEPLRKIQTFSDLIATSHADALGESGQDMMRRMRSSAERMSSLIKGLLTYSRLSDRVEPFSRVSLTEVLRLVLNDLDLLIAESNADIIADPLPDISGHSRQLQQLFHNLLTNALKFRRVGVRPQVQIRCRRVALADLSALPALAGSPALAFHEISVCDNGIGFEEKYLSRIFQVFQRLHNRSEFDGSGIGLAICKKVVENHNGDLTAVSTPGAGATFLVYLPER